MILSDLLPDVLGRIEENVEDGPIFWSQVGEVYIEMVDGAFEASLVTGVVQTSQVSITLPANKTYFSLQASSTGFDSDAALFEKGILAPIRMRQAWPIRKSSLKTLDDMYPAWQKADPSTQLIAWFPLGVSGFGIYPQFSVETTVTMDFITCPINTYRPYTGNETLPFQDEFNDAFAKFAASMLRMKEGGAEAEEAASVQEQYLADIKSLSLFQTRVDSLILSAAFGGRGQVNPRTAV